MSVNTTMCNDWGRGVSKYISKGMTCGTGLHLVEYIINHMPAMFGLKALE